MLNLPILDRDTVSPTMGLFRFERNLKFNDDFFDDEDNDG